MRLLSREELEMAQFAPKDDSRYAQSPYLAVWSDRVEVTNGHYAIVYADSGKPPAADFPALPGESNDTEPTWPVLIPRESALAAVKALPKKSHIPILGFAALAGGKLYATDLELWKTITIVSNGARFPDISKVMPTEAPSPMAEDAGFSADYLAVIAKAVKIIAENGRSLAVSMLPHNSGPTIWTAQALGGSRKLTIALMPMKVR